MGFCWKRLRLTKIAKLLITLLLVAIGYEVLLEMTALMTIRSYRSTNEDNLPIPSHLEVVTRPSTPPSTPKPLTGCEFETAAQETHILSAARRSRNGHFLYIRNCSGCVLENSAQKGYTLDGSGVTRTAADCFNKCDQNPRCHGATLDILNGCWFHKEVVADARSTKAGFMLYIRQCRVCELSNTAQNGYYMHDDGFPSKKSDCFGTCDQKPECRGATLDIHDICRLHFKIVLSNRMLADGHTLYIKDCKDCDLEPTVSQAYELKGTGFRSRKSDCFDTCDQNRECRGATWDINNFCWPHSEIVPTDRRTLNEHSFYVKHCDGEGDWTFTHTVKCPLITLTENKARKKLVLDCKDDKGVFEYTTTADSRDLFTLPFKSKCLDAAIQNNCYDGRAVPNVVHYSFFRQPNFEYLNYLSFMSAIKFIKPCMIVIHGDSIPSGTYWDHVINTYPDIIHMNRSTPEMIGTYKLAYTTHASDLLRIEAILTYGGIYLDGDEVVLHPVDHLRNFRHTQGFESDDYLTSAFMLGEKNGTFLRIWHATYFTDYKNTWAYNAMYLPAKLAKQHPETIHTVGGKFTDPGPETGTSYKLNFNWSRNYGMHIYRYAFDGVLTNERIRTLNTTVGSVARHILFGNKELCEN